MAQDAFPKETIFVNLSATQRLPVSVLEITEVSVSGVLVHMHRWGRRI
jgi:hypothetical protein